MSGAPEAITFTPRSGGRIFERAAGGQEHDWGEVLDWSPPTRVRCLWHLFFDRSEATEIELTFTPVAAGTRVRLEHRGWERLGDAGPPRRTRTGQVWAALTTSYRDAVFRG
jgi:Activator of Hsp90 ATPase homolog 1-like protein